MPKCKIKDCQKFTRYINTKNTYCDTHLARIGRHGHPNLKKDSHGLEKLPHHFVDDFIRENCKKLIDKQIAILLKEKGFKDAAPWTIKYRRRKLGIKKYLYGEIKKHKTWVRTQAIKKYGSKCELCGFKLAVDTHHILSKKEGGLHAIENLIVLCPNCHALITRGHLTLTSRNDIASLKNKLTKLLKSRQPYFG